MPVRDISAITQRLFAEIERLEARFPGYRRFGPRSVVGALQLLVAGCLVESYDEALEAVMQRFGDGLGWDSAPARSGLTAARKQLGVAPLHDLWQSMVRYAEEGCVGNMNAFPEPRRYLAVDGSWMLMPDTNGVRKRWNQAGTNSTCTPQALLLCAIDIAQRLPVAASVSGLDIGERLAATRLLLPLNPDDVLLFDRGYPGRAFFAELHNRGCDWCARMTVGPGAFPEVNSFWESGADDTETWLDLGDGGMVKVRLIRRRFPRGRPQQHQKREEMVIITTLLDRNLYSPEVILELYHARWQAETFFREIKVAFGIEAFHSRDPDGIMQEVYAIMTWMTVASMIERDADSRIADLRGPQNWNDPQRYSINRSQLFRAIRSQAAAILDHDPDIRKEATQRLDHDVARLVKQAAKRRPGRSFERHRKRPWGRWKNKD